MIHVDVVCEAEHLPRLQLLQTHMRSLNVELQIHETVPEPCSDRLLIVPRQRNSKLSSLQIAGDCERIALFLDEQTEPVEADMQVTLHSWPARSSDRHVEILARHLHSSRRRTLAAEDIRDSASSNRSTGSSEIQNTLRAATKAKQTERRKNILILSLLGASVVVLFSLLDTGPKKVAEPPQPEPEQQAPLEPPDSGTYSADFTTDFETDFTTDANTEESENEETVSTQREANGMDSLKQKPEMVVLDETGARIRYEAGPRLCSEKDRQDGLSTTDCQLILF